MNWRHRQNMPLAVIHAERMTDYPIEVDRWSGLVICTKCGHQMYGHPRHPLAPECTVTCDGKVVKL